MAEKPMEAHLYGAYADWLDQICCWNVLQVVPAQYAFVVHTANPIMGEALVGNYPGRALSFSAAPGQQVCCHVMSA